MASMTMIDPKPVEAHPSHVKPTKQRPVIISSDCGIDDAQALAIALQSHKAGLIDILAICATHGNVALPSVIGNICAVLAAAKTTDIPVYVGAEVPLVAAIEEDASLWHGKEGLGNTGFGERASRDCVRKDMTAAEAIVAISKKHWEAHAAGDAEAEKTSIITLGPLTDLAVAVRLEARLTQFVDTVFVMGGAERCHGNCGFPLLAAEYNIRSDPEAAQVVFSAASFPRVVMVSWELTLKYGLKPDFLSLYLGQEGTVMGRFIAAVTKHLVDASGEEYIATNGLMIPDPLAMMVAVDPTIITDSAKHAVFVETRGQYTRGATIVDFSDQSKRPRNVEVVFAVDFEKVKKMLMESVS